MSEEIKRCLKEDIIALCSNETHELFVHQDLRHEIWFKIFWFDLEQQNSTCSPVLVQTKSRMVEQQ